MCKWCVTHGDGGRWFANTQNYAQKMYKLRKKDVERKGAEANPQTMAEDLLAEALEARTLNPEQFPMLKKRAEQLSHTIHFGQVVTLEDVKAIIDISWPIVKMSCACRRHVRGLPDNENYFCIGLGVGMFKWERWPETYRGGVEFLTPEEAKQWLEHVNQKGMVHTFFTFGTPYIGGICNCETPTCMAIRNRVDYGIEMLFKGEYVAMVNHNTCTGCGNCIERCQFGALKMEPTMNQATVDMMKCFGCGLCQTGCRKGAVELLDRNSLPVLAGNW